MTEPTPEIAVPLGAAERTPLLKEVEPSTITTTLDELEKLRPQLEALGAVVRVQITLSLEFDR